MFSNSFIEFLMDNKDVLIPGPKVIVIRCRSKYCTSPDPVVECLYNSKNEFL